MMSIARGSLGELQDSIDEARLKRYISDDEWRNLDSELRAAKAKASGLRAYLLRTPTPESRRRQQPRSGQQRPTGASRAQARE